MAIGNFTRQTLENDVQNNVGDLVGALNRLAALDQRATAEFAAGTFDQDDWYGIGSKDPAAARDKANLLGTLDQMKALRDYLVSHGTVAAPSDPLQYAVFVF